MPKTARIRPQNNNLNRPAANSALRRAPHNKTMKREFIFPLIVGIIVGALVMILWQFNARLSAQINAVGQLQQATAQNSKTLSDIVSFLNNATGQNQTGTNSTTTGQ